MRKKIAVFLIFSVIALLFLISLVTVCYIKRKGKGTRPATWTPLGVIKEVQVPVKISKTEAISLAKEAIAKEGYKVAEYKFVTIEGEAFVRAPWWTVYFETKRPGYYPGGVQSIQVSVHKETGEIEIYADTQVKISRTEAISLAKQAATKVGYKVGEYNFEVDQAYLGGRPCWAIMFELKRPADYLGGGELFSVLVDWESGAIKVYGRTQVKISKTEAISLAKEAAERAGYKVDEYNFEFDEGFLDGRPHWWFYFELKRPVDYFGGDQHFSMGVDKETGETYLFGGR